jgi:hypothetical protein
MTAYKLSITGKIEATGEVENISLSGEILSAEYEPSEIKIFEKITVTTAVKNNGKEKNDYLLEFKIIKNGELKNEDKFMFPLSPDRTVSFSPTYNLNEVGEYKIVIRIYDMSKITLYDEKILTIVAQSDVGPFDLEVDVPSHMIKLGDSLPLTVKITNVGIKGIDIGLDLELRCTNGKKISKSMYIFVNGSSDIEKQLFMDLCGDIGQHTVTASLILYGNELIASKTQFYVNATLPEILMNMQQLIKAENGKKNYFAIEVKNPNDFDLMNIKPFVYGMPSDWIFIEPSSFNTLKPNESAIFTAIIDAPKTAEMKNYEITVGIGGDNMLIKKEAMVSVTGIATKTFVTSSSIYQLLSTYWIQIVLIFAAVTLTFVFFRYRRKK